MSRQMACCFPGVSGVFEGTPKILKSYSVLKFDIFFMEV